MEAARKFLFDRSFDQARKSSARALQEAAEAAEPPPPTFSEAELKEARREAYEAGRQSGIDEAKESIEQSRALALQSAGSQLEALIARHDQAAEQRRAEAMEVALAALTALFPTLELHLGFAEVEAAIGQALSRLEVEPRVVIRIADQIIDPLREQLTELAQRNAFDGKLMLVPDDTLGPAAVRIEWASGGAERDCTRVWQELQAMIDERIAALRNAEVKARAEAALPEPPDQAELPDQAEPADRAAPAGAPAELETV